MSARSPLTVVCFSSLLLACCAEGDKPGRGRLAALEAGIADGGAAPPDSAGGTCAHAEKVPFRVDQCKACMSERCCEAMTTCGSNKECIALRECGGEPGQGEGPGWIACTDEHPTGYPDHAVVSSCMPRECAAECEVAEDKCAVAYIEDDRCEACVAANCCDKFYATSSSAVYWEYSLCRELCANDAACVEQCQIDHAAGARLEESEMGCMIRSCVVECLSAPDGDGGADTGQADASAGDTETTAPSRT